mmetsp:Transcript_52782/g.168965  ORF Transcript_52782/g.168965 Transcript_52782/m.168965 type:complete len:264 (-) Transcript_52782:260-1051(-)
MPPLLPLEPLEPLDPPLFPLPLEPLPFFLLWRRSKMSCFASSICSNMPRRPMCAVCRSLSFGPLMPIMAPLLFSTSYANFQSLLKNIPSACIGTSIISSSMPWHAARRSSTSSVSWLSAAGSPTARSSVVSGSSVFTRVNSVTPVILCSSGIASAFPMPLQPGVRVPSTKFLIELGNSISWTCGSSPTCRSSRAACPPSPSPISSAKRASVASTAAAVPKTSNTNSSSPSSLSTGRSATLEPQDRQRSINVLPPGPSTCSRSP